MFYWRVNPIYRMIELSLIYESAKPPLFTSDPFLILIFREAKNITLYVFSERLWFVSFSYYMSSYLFFFVWWMIISYQFINRWWFFFSFKKAENGNGWLIKWLVKHWLQHHREWMDGRIVKHKHQREKVSLRPESYSTARVVVSPWGGGAVAWAPGIDHIGNARIVHWIFAYFSLWEHWLMSSLKILGI